MKAPTIDLSHVSVAFDNQSLFNNLSIEFKGGCWHTIIGPSGCGKSTLLRLLAGLINERYIAHSEQISASNKRLISQQFSYLSQHDSLLPWLSALDNTLIGYRLRGELTNTTRQKAIKWLERVGLGDNLNQLPHTLSGGMKQRVALVRTVLEDQPILLLDEPFSALDAITRLQMQDYAAQLFHNKTVLLVTHDALEAARLSDQVWLLAGQPSQIQQSLSLSDTPPRCLQSSQTMSYQQRLFQLLEQNTQATTETSL